MALFLPSPGMPRARSCLDDRRFADNSHAAYYSSRVVTCGASSSSGSSSGGKAPKAGRGGSQAGRVRVLQMAREAEAVLASLEQRPAGVQAHPLDRWGSASSSESESEGEARLPSSSSGGGRAATRQRRPTAQVAVCTGKSCQKRGSGAVLTEFQAATAGTSIGVTACGKCMGHCKLGPAVRATAPDGKVTIVTGVTTGVAPAVLANTLLAGAFYCPVASPASYSY